MTLERTITMNPQQRIARKMQQFRMDAGLSQKEVATRLGIHPRSYRRWEAADSFGYLYRLQEVAQILGVSEAALLEGSDLDEALPPRELLNAKLDLVLEQLRSMQDELDDPRRDRD